MQERVDCRIGSLEIKAQYRKVGTSVDCRIGSLEILSAGLIG